LRAVLSTCGTFQDWVDAEDAAEALSSIYEIEEGAEDVVRPFAIVDDGDEFEGERIDAGGEYRTTGSLFLLFEGAVDTSTDKTERDAQYAFTNVVGGIMEELLVKARPGSAIYISGFSKVHGPARTPEKERASGGDYMQVGFRVGWW
jgi:hypothetical protein